MIKETLEYVGQGLDMTQNHAHKTMMEIMSGDWTPVQIAGFLMALRMKGETVNEISGFVNAMRDKATKIQAPRRYWSACLAVRDTTIREPRAAHAIFLFSAQCIFPLYRKK